MYLTGIDQQRDKWISQTTEQIMLGRRMFFIAPTSVKRIAFSPLFGKQTRARARRLAEQIYDVRDVFIKRSETITCQHYFLKG